MRKIPIVLLLLAVGESSLFVSAQEKDLYLRWSSDGSGYRSLPLQIGYANLFQQAGLISATGSRFASISMSSSGSWFSNQLFYSPVFFERTVMAKNPDELGDFMESWMESYERILNPFGGVFHSGVDSAVAEALTSFKVSIQLWVKAVLEVTSTQYGDPGLIHRPAGHDNRVPALRKTDHYIANALHPNTRLNDAFGLFQDSVTYIGPSDSKNVYTYVQNIASYSAATECAFSHSVPFFP